MNKYIVLLIDYRDQFYFSTKYRGACVDIEKLKTYFEHAGYTLEIKHFHEINLRNDSYKDKWVLYQSSEDPNLLYKDYIEDILLAMKLQGAKLIPDFEYFRAHHNKVFMELLRDLLDIEETKNIHSRGFGTYEEYLASPHSHSNSPVVIKPGSGTRSRDVKLLTTLEEKKVVPFKISRSFTLDNIKLFISKIMTRKHFTPMSNNRKKFIIQNFIPGLLGDYRILIYGDKYYVVFRENRDNHFTASGSGKLKFEIEIPYGLFDFAKSIYTQLNTPFMSLDVGYVDGKYFLFEFQCLCLGQYTLEKSQFYYKLEAGTWNKVYEIPDLEREISSSIIKHIEK